MSQQTTGLKRDDTDKYYTAHIVDFCVNKFQETVTNLTDAVIIEPSAEMEHLFQPFKTLTDKHLFYDKTRKRNG